MTVTSRWPAIAWVLLVAAGGVTVCNLPTARTADAPSAIPLKPYGIEPAPFAQLSSASCEAESCHGGVGGKGGEHTTWAAEAFPGRPSDPHSRGHRVLFNDVSKRIGTALGITPHREALCLKCHAVPDVPEVAHGEGVGCGGCHGPAERWAAAHVTPGWSGLTTRQKSEGYGLAPTKNLVGRALICAGCHVGDATRDVNHDLIAAGHPRLLFEATQHHFHTGYSRHWTERTPQPGFEVRGWLAGQAATARAATELLRVRAVRATQPRSGTPWPEFAGLSCYACHQSVGGDGPPSGKTPALAGWELYATTALPTAAAFTPVAFPGTAPPDLTAFAELQRIMAKRSPDEATVAEVAGRAVAALDAWLTDLQAAEDRGLPPLPADLPRQVTHALADPPLDADWDALAARYLGCAAMAHASGGRVAHPGWAEPIRGLSRRLAFPTNAAGFRFDSPAHLAEVRADIADRFRTLLNATAASGVTP